MSKLFMEENYDYEEIVGNWYERLRGGFIVYLMSRYRQMSRAEAENIYQDVFLAIYDNLGQGRLREDTNWSAYVWTIGLRMAGRLYGPTVPVFESIDEAAERAEEGQTGLSVEIGKRLGELMAGDDMEDREEVMEIVEQELQRLSETNIAILRMSCSEGRSDLEIARQLPPYSTNGKRDEVNAKAIKARRWKCLRELKAQVATALESAGINDVRLEKQAK